MRGVARFLRSRFNTSLQALVRELPLRDLLPLGAAIALLFSVLGPVSDILKGSRAHGPQIDDQTLLLIRAR